MEPPVLISPAYAQASGASADAGIMNIGMLVLMLVVFWFILIRPQMKRAKEHKAMVEALEKGAEVVTAGGIVGRITKIGDGYITLEIADNTEIVVQRNAVQTLLPKGTMKSL
jgi:preprotein translocase subunit YajC